MNATSIPWRQMAELKTHNDVVAYVLCILLIIIIKVTPLNSYVKLKKRRRRRDNKARDGDNIGVDISV